MLLAKASKGQGERAKGTGRKFRESHNGGGAKEMVANVGFINGEWLWGGVSERE